MEKLLLRPTLSNHFANLISSTLTPVIERQIKDLLGSNFYQYQSQQTSSLHQDLVREMRSEIAAIKSDLGNWHGENIRTQEVIVFGILGPHIRLLNKLLGIYSRS